MQTECELIKLENCPWKNFYFDFSLSRNCKRQSISVWPMQRSEHDTLKNSIVSMARKMNEDKTRKKKKLKMHEPNERKMSNENEWNDDKTWNCCGGKLCWITNLTIYNSNLNSSFLSFSLSMSRLLFIASSFQISFHSSVETETSPWHRMQRWR